MIRRAWRLSHIRIVPPITWWWISRPPVIPPQPIRFPKDDDRLDALIYAYRALPVRQPTSGLLYLPVQ